MSLTPYGLSLGLGNDPFFGQLEKAMDRAFDRALGSRGGDITMFLPSLTGPSTSSGHPMVSRLCRSIACMPSSVSSAARLQKQRVAG